MYNIYQLIDPDGVLYAPTPDLLAQCAEILDAQARAAEAARLATVRERLAGLLPVTRPVVIESRAGQALAGELWPGAKEGEV